MKKQVISTKIQQVLSVTQGIEGMSIHFHFKNCKFNSILQ